MYRSMLFSISKSSSSTTTSTTTTTSSSAHRFQFLKQFQIVSISKLVFLTFSSSSSSAAAFQQSRTFSFCRPTISAATTCITTSTSTSTSTATTPSLLQSRFAFPSTLSFSTHSMEEEGKQQQQQQRTFLKLSERRITALFANPSSQAKAEGGSAEAGAGAGTGTGAGENDYSTKNRSRELKRLSKTMQMDISKVKQLLQAQSKKLDANSEKGKYVNWLLLDGRGNGNGHENGRKGESKRRRADSTVATANGNENGNVNGAGTAQDSSSKISSSNKRTPKKPKAQRVKVESIRESQSGPIAEPPQDPPSPTNNNLLSESTFQNINLHPSTKKAITNLLKHSHMTDIQAKTYEAASSGTDVLGRARTGTGKTLAFLVPALERIIQSSNTHFTPGKNIGILVVSPTRELATQIGDQAEKLLTYHRDMHCQVMYGGTKMVRDVNRLNNNKLGLPTILVATPGRLLDHLENTRLSNGQRFGKDVMRDTPLLVLDEADRLLDMGFQREIKKIMSYLPRQEKRQTLLFSATVPDALKQIMAENMREDFVEVDCIGGDGNSEFQNEEHTNVQVEQSHVVLPSLDRYVTSVVEIVKHSMKDPDHKLVVFFPTARLVGYFAELFNLGLGIDVIELHSRKTQGYRNQASEKFRKAKRAILFTSDVSARGVDYPNVSGVIQFGLPENRDQYIHRLGRTGRAGKEGKGIIVLAPFEKKFLSELKDIEIPSNEEISQMLQNPVDRDIMNDLNGVFDRIRSGDGKLTTSAQQAYQAFIGYYRGQMKRTSIRNNEQLVDVANEYSKLMGLKEIPGITSRAAGKMGLKGLHNVRIVSESEIRRGGNKNPRGKRR